MGRHTAKKAKVKFVFSSPTVGVPDPTPAASKFKILRVKR